MQSMSDVTSVPVEIQDGRCLSDVCRRLLYEISDNPATVFRREADIFVRETEGTGRLDEHSSTLRLFGVVQQRVLVVIEPANHRDDEQDQDNDPAVHPVDEDEDENRGSAYSPEFPEEERQETTEGLGRAEPHVPIRGEHGGWHGNWKIWWKLQ